MGDSALATVTQIGFTLGGFAIGGPFGAMVGATLGAFVANELFGEDVEVSRGRVADLKVATSEYGFPVAHIWGCMRVGGSAYFNSDLIEKTNTESTSSKGGQTVKSTTFFYSIDIGYKFAINLANFPVVSMPKGWANGKLIWDFSNETGPIFDAKYVGETGGPFNQGTIRLRFGDEDQLPDPTYEVYGGVGTTPADRGYAVAILEDFPLEDFGNSPPQLNSVVCTAVNPAYPVATMSGWTVNTQSVFFAPDGRTLYKVIEDDMPALVNSDTRDFIIGLNTVELQPLVGTGNNDGNNPQGFHDIDQFGRGLSEDENLATIVIPFLHDVRDYSVIARAANGASNIVGSGAALRFFGTSDERIFVAGNSGQSYAVFNSGTFTAAVSGVDGATFTGSLIPLIVADSWANSVPALANFPNWAMDEQTGHLWTAHDSGADTILVHWSLDFVEIERFTITSHLTSDMGYDKVSHSFFFSIGTSTLWRWSIDDEAIFATEITGESFSNTASGFASIHEGNLYLEGGAVITRYDIPTMTIVKTYDLGDGAKWNIESTIDAPVYDPFLHAVILSPGTNTPLYWAFLDRESEGSVTLESILNDEVLLSGYEGGPTDRDATDHSATTVLGWAANARTSVVGESQAQADLYKFGHVESDHKIKFPARGRATSFALTDDDLGVVVHGSAPTQKLQITRLDQSSLDVSSELRFLDPAMDYQEGLQKAILQPETVPGTDKEGSRAFKVVMTPAEAKRREFLHLTQQYSDQQRYRFTTFHKEMEMDPGDTGTITADGKVHLVMLEDTALGANMIYECAAVGFVVPTTAEADAILTQIHTQNTDLQAQTSDGFVEQSIGSLNQTDFAQMDTVYLDDRVDQGNTVLEYQFAARRRSAGLSWNGAVISRSIDNIDFSQWHLYESAFEGEIGRTETALARPVDPALIDDTNTVDVSFRADLVLASVTDVELFEGKNAFLIGKEIINAGTVTDNGDGSWTLSHLLRARRGTEWAAGIKYFQDVAPDHTQWETVFYLGNAADANKAMFKGSALADLDVEHFYQAESLNAVAGGAQKIKFTNTGNCLRPLSPIPISGSKVGSDWNGTITRRNRVGGDLKSFADIPQTDPAIYEIDVIEEASTNAVIRTITATASANGSVVNADGTWVYDVLDMESDFSESPLITDYPQYRLKLIAYQLNDETVGRGHPGPAVFEDFPDPLPADASFSSVELLLRANSLNVVDKSSNVFPITVGNDLTLTEGDIWLDGISMYGSGVIEFSDSANSELRIPRADIGTTFDLAAQNFTLEGWLHQDEEHAGELLAIWGSSGNQEFIWSFRTGGTNNGAMRFDWTTDGNTDKGVPVTLATGLSFGLVHVAVVRDGTDIRFYRDGTQLGATQTIGADTIFSGGAADLTIGVQDNGTTNNFRGKLDSLRVTIGVVRYSGSTYTIPAHAFPNF